MSIPEPAPSRAAALVAVLALLASMASCTSFRPVPLDAIATEIEPGDTVRVTIDRGAMAEFEVTNVDGAAISGVGAKVEVEEIVLLEKREFSLARTLGFGAATAAATYVVVGTIALGVYIATFGGW